MTSKLKQPRNASPEELDLWFLKHPMEWPRWPMLPLKRRNGAKFSDDFYCGLFVHGLGNGGFRVYKLNMFHLPNSPLIKTWDDAVKHIKFEHYETPEALIAEWKID